MSFYSQNCNNYTYPNGVIDTPTSECYSSLAAYGVQGAVSGIVAPRPVTGVPPMINKLGPTLANPVPWPKVHYNQSIHKSVDCSPYAKFSQSCQKTAFQQMFDTRRR